MAVGGGGMGGGYLFRCLFQVVTLLSFVLKYCCLK